MVIISSRVCWGYGGLKLKKRHTVDTVAVRGVAARCVCGEVRLRLLLSNLNCVRTEGVKGVWWLKLKFLEAIQKFTSNLKSPFSAIPTLSSLDHPVLP